MKVSIQIDYDPDDERNVVPSKELVEEILNQLARPSDEKFVSHFSRGARPEADTPKPINWLEEDKRS